MSLTFCNLIENKILKQIITILEENKFIVTESCKNLIEDLNSYQEIDNEFNRMIGKNQTFAYLYVSALLYYVSEKGWPDPVKYLLQIGVRIEDMLRMDSNCTVEKISKNVLHLFNLETFLKEALEYE